jgi:hypothetical protein
MLYIAVILKVHWCDNNVLNFHAPTEDKNDIKDGSYEEPEHGFDIFSKYHMTVI